jgi:hypothetical protein
MLLGLAGHPKAAHYCYNKRRSVSLVTAAISRDRAPAVSFTNSYM